MTDNKQESACLKLKVSKFSVDQAWYLVQLRTYFAYENFVKTQAKHEN